MSTTTEIIKEVITSEAFLDFVMVVISACFGGSAVIAKNRSAIKAGKYLAEKLLENDPGEETVPEQHKRIIKRMAKRKILS